MPNYGPYIYSKRYKAHQYRSVNFCPNPIPKTLMQFLSHCFSEYASGIHMEKAVHQSFDRIAAKLDAETEPIIAQEYVGLILHNTFANMIHNKR